MKKCVLCKSNLLLLSMIMLCSCVSRRQLTYFPSITAESSKEVNQFFNSQPEPFIKVNDALIIAVSALDMEAVQPYNLHGISFNTPLSTTEPTSTSYQYYTVDMQGDIDFPVLGKLHVAGLTQSQLIDTIQTRLKGQIIDPIVTVRFLNAKVTVLGEVCNPGSYELNKGRMTLLEALGAAGDFTQYGRKDNVLIVRESDGNIEFARVDLTSDEVFKSPYFYLQQNDVVMVEPNRARSISNQTVGLWLSMIGTLSSAATVIVSVISATGK